MKIHRPLALALAIAALHGAARATEPASTPYNYFGASAGISRMPVNDIALSAARRDENSRSVKVYIGRELNDWLGVQAGLVDLGHVANTYALAGAAVEQRLHGQAAYAAMTARLALGKQFELNTKLGLYAGRASGANRLGSGHDATGSRRGVVALSSLGALWHVSERLALTAELERVGKLSSKVDGSTAQFGLRMAF